MFFGDRLRPGQILCESAITPLSPHEIFDFVEAPIKHRDALAIAVNTR